MQITTNKKELSQKHIGGYVGGLKELAHFQAIKKTSFTFI